MSCSDKDDKLEVIPEVVTPVDSSIYLSVSDTLKVIPPAGSTSTLSIKSNSDWVIVVDSSWCTVTPLSGHNNGNISITVPRYEDMAERSALVKISSGDTVRTVCVLQTPYERAILDTSSFVISQLGGEFTVNVTSNVDVTVTIPDTVQSWVFQPIGTRSVSTSTLTFSVSPNDTYFDRSGSIIINAGSYTDTISIAQPVFAEFEDPEFEKFCLEKYDLDKDGHVSGTEASKVKYIFVFTDNISSLKGVEYFQNLEALLANPYYSDNWDYCYEWIDKIMEAGFPFSGSPKLMGVGDNGGHDTGNWRDNGLVLVTGGYATVVHGMLKSLDVSKLSKLRFLNCSGNDIRSIDLSSNSELYLFSALGNLDLSDVNITGLTKLAKINLQATSIHTIDVSSLPDLEWLKIGDGAGINSIDVTHNPKLVELSIRRHSLKTIDLSNNPLLTHFEADMGDLESVDFSHNRNLYCVGVDFNKLTSLDVTGLVNLEILSATSNSLTELDLSTNVKLKYVAVLNYLVASDGSIPCNSISKVDVTNCPDLIGSYICTLFIIR